MGVVNWTLKQTFAKLLKNLLICESQRRSRLIEQSSSRRRQTNKAEDKVAAHNFYYKIFRATLKNIFDFKMMTTLLQIVLALAIITTVVDSAAIGDIARNVHSDLLTLDAGLNPQPVRSPRQDFDVPAGGAVDMFYRYGFFSLSVRVVPRDDPGKWLVREPTANIFDQQSLVIENKAGPNTFARQPVQISLCEDLDELMEAFFRNFKADGVEQPHKLFTGSWRLPTAAHNIRLDTEAATEASKVHSGDSEAILKFVKN